MNLILLKKSIYGKELYYPKNDIALTICKLMKKVTLNSIHLGICKEAGWNIEVHYDTNTLRNDTNTLPNKNTPI